jgi:hypothetical protein
LNDEDEYKDRHKPLPVPSLYSDLELLLWVLFALLCAGAAVACLIWWS